VALDPLTSSILTLDEIKKMVEEMLEGETRYLPKFWPFFIRESEVMY